MDKVIKVIGNGTIKVKPDLVIITVGISNVQETYECAIKDSTDKIQEVTNTFLEAFIPKENIRTTSFNITEENERYEKSPGCYKYRFIGYRYSVNLIIRFRLDNTLLGKVLTLLSHSPVNPEIRIDYGLEDEEEVKSKVIEKSIDNAMKKARIITQSANVRLLDIVNIDYLYEPFNIDCKSRCNLMLGSDNDIANLKINFEPDDIEINDQVTITWNIEQDN